MHKKMCRAHIFLCIMVKKVVLLKVKNQCLQGCGKAVGCCK